MASNPDWLANFLRDFNHHRLVKVYIESDSTSPGSFVMGKVDMQREIMPIRLYDRVDGYAETALWPFWQWERIAGEEAAARNEPPDGWVKDTIIAQASAAAGIDVLVTASTRLLSNDLHWISAANPMSVGEAVALLGLYLRGHNDFTINQGQGGRMSYSRGLFYWVATRDLLKESWRWFTGLSDYWQATRDQSLLMLGQSVLQRFDRSLRARDAVHLQMVVPHNNDTADEAMAQLDVLLVFLLGAFDASAQIFHRTVGLEGGKFAGWHKARWVESVGGRVPAVVAIVGPGSYGANVLKILAALRNSIHGEALQTVAFHDTIIGPRETLITLGLREHEELLESIEKLGGRRAWGVRDLLPDAAGVEVDTFDFVARLLNQLMQATPVERLTGVDVTALPDGPPEDDQVFGVRQRRWIRALMGI
jgi:hypothetical protein